MPTTLDYIFSAMVMPPLSMAARPGPCRWHGSYTRLLAMLAQTQLYSVVTVHVRHISFAGTNRFMVTAFSDVGRL